MKIKTVHYSALINLGNYNNEKIGFTADIEENETVESTIEALRLKVKEMGGVDADKMYNEIRDKRYQLGELERKVKKATEEWNALAEFLRSQGIKKDVVDMPMFTNLLPEVKQEQITDGELVETEDMF